jgi:AcrR family transcriptional regulator
MASKSPLGPRARLLEAADKLFYEEGIHTVGIDRLLEQAGVAKASLYSTFGSKDALVAEYLSARLVQRKERVEAALAPLSKPREQILAVFDVLSERVAEKEFRGCAFFRAAAEGEPTPRLDAVLTESRNWLHDLFRDLCAHAGACAPERLATQLVLLYDGAIVVAQMDRDSSAPRVARDAAEALLDAQHL